MLRSWDASAPLPAPVMGRTRSGAAPARLYTGGLAPQPLGSSALGQGPCCLLLH